MSEDNRRPSAPQGSVAFDELQPFLILRRNDGSFSVAARATGNVVSIAPLVAIPDPPKRRLYECPCCGRPFILSEWPDGHATITPIPKPPDDSSDIPF
jgi:hypothetical protein